MSSDPNSLEYYDDINNFFMDLPSPADVLAVQQPLIALPQAKKRQPTVPRAEPYSQNPRPFLSYVALCGMAIHNSPSGFVTSSEVYEFILHHFPHFHDMSPSWRNTVRHVLSRKKEYFRAIEGGTRKLKYGFAEEVTLEKCLNKDSWTFMKEKDQRTFDYYEWILQGQDAFLWNLSQAQQVQ